MIGYVYEYRILREVTVYELCIKWIGYIVGKQNYDI